MGFLHFPHFPKTQSDEDSAKWRSLRRLESYTWDVESTQDEPA